MEKEIARVDGMRVLLTADRTLMSNHRENEFFGFGATAPPNVVPEWLYKQLFFPPIKTKSGMPVEAPYGLRKVEAQLMNEGFSVLTVDPDHLNRYIDDAAMGKRTHGFILVNVKPGSVKEVSKQLCEIERVSEVHEVHGSEDLIVKVGAKSLGRLRSVILRVRGIPDVVETEFIPVFKTWKG